MPQPRRSCRIAAHSEEVKTTGKPVSYVEIDDEALILENVKESNCGFNTPVKKKTKATSTTMATPRSATRRALKKRSDAVNSQSSGCSCSGAEDLEFEQTTPPKQCKQEETYSWKATCKSSPTYMLKRLSIDGRSNIAKITESIKESLTKREHNKYQKARRVLNSTETNNLPGREQQLRTLRNFFNEHLNEQRSGSLYVSGQPGTGKTACLSLLLRDAEFAQRLQRVYINCTSIATVHSIYKKICAELKLKTNGQTERDCLEAIQKHLCKSKRMLLLVLDEIDQLCNARQSVLYTIFEWPALPDAKILLVGIANSLDLTDRTLIRLNACCDLKPTLLHFPPYTKTEIVDIFKSRLAEADVLDVFPPVTLQLLAAKVSAVNGDVRRALDIGRRVVELAEQQKREGKQEFDIGKLEVEDDLKPVQVTQVAAVLNNVYGASQTLDDDIEESFPLQQKLLLCTLLLILRNERSKDVAVTRLYEIYRRVCNKNNIQALDHTEFVGNIDLVETRGILRVMRKKEQRLNRVVLQWDEEEVNAALSNKQLIASIIADTSCLRK